FHRWNGEHQYDKLHTARLQAIGGTADGQIIPWKQTRDPRKDPGIFAPRGTVAKSPKSDREAVYELMRASLGDAGRVLNLSDKEMADFENNYMTWLRALVDMIERGGGAPGCRA